MKGFSSSPIIAGLCRTCTNMYAHGWDERNGGNISLLLDEKDIEGYKDIGSVIRRIPTGFKAHGLDGRYVLITGTGKYFKNVQYDPETNLGLLRIGSGGYSELVWGLKDGGGPTSELAAHIMGHAARLSVNSENRVIMHCHPTNILAMTFVHDLEERSFTRELWRMISECIIVFPDGINVLPWMLCGTNEIGEATAKKLLTARIVVWAQHGIYGAGSSLDEAFGLIETVEKAAEIYMKTAPFKILNTITDEQLKLLAEHYGVTPREGYLEL